MKNGGPPLEGHFIFEIYVGKIRIQYKTTLKLNDETLDRLKIDDVIQIQSRSMSDPNIFTELISKLNGLCLEYP